MRERTALTLCILLLTLPCLGKDKKKDRLPELIMRAQYVAVVEDPDSGISLADPAGNRVAQRDVEMALENGDDSRSPSTLAAPTWLSSSVKPTRLDPRPLVAELAMDLWSWTPQATETYESARPSADPRDAATPIPPGEMAREAAPRLAPRKIYLRSTLAIPTSLWTRSFSGVTAAAQLCSIWEFQRSRSSARRLRIPKRPSLNRAPLIAAAFPCI
jgi:hypothetical protein